MLPLEPIKLSVTSKIIHANEIGQAQIKYDLLAAVINFIRMENSFNNIIPFETEEGIVYLASIETEAHFIELRCLEKAK